MLSNIWHARNVSLIFSSCSSGQFACRFSDPSAILPGLAVAGFGDVNLPLDLARAQALLELCQAAPCVKAADTVGDVSVRSFSQLDPALLS